MASNKKKLQQQIVDLLIITFGITLYAFGFCVFVLPHDIVIGGMAGFATLVYYATMEKMPIAITMYGTNLLLLFMGFKALGKTFVVRTIFGVTVLSVLIGAGEGYFSSHPPLITSTPMSVIMGSVLMGLGIGMYYGRHGTCGGTDIIAALLTHRTRLSMGRVLMIVDVTIVSLSFFLPFDGNMEQRLQVRTETIIYGMMAIFIYSTLADRYVNAGKQTIQFIVLSDKWEEIAYRVSHETGRGITMWEVKGYWTGEKRNMLLMWCRKYDVYQITTIIRDCDDHAFIMTNHVKGVYGNGFDHLRISHPNILTQQR